MPQNTNLNVSPYFDDFDDSKGYQKVLFKPGTPLQARELTTLQSILQSQIEKFGQHFFKEGSIVIPGQISYDPNYTCIQLNQTHLGIPISTYIDNFVGKLIRGQTSGVIAKVENYIDDIESENSNFTLYIKYISSSDINFSTPTFIDGENLISIENVDYSISTIRANSTFASTISNNSNSIGSAAKITDGVYFVRGFFIKVNSQTLLLDQYSNLPSYRVGLQINEELAVASNNYNDLFDNAQGFSNFAAPGADRLRISLELVKKDLQDFNDKNFIELLRVRNGEIEKFVTNSNYNLIRDELARRTYDESGDYYIKPFDISIKESLNDEIGNNGTFYSGEITRQGNIPSNDLMCLSISPGKAYVRGYEVETRGVLLDLDKPRTTEKVENETLQFTFGNQIIVNNVHNSISLGLGNTNQVSFYRDRNATKGSVNGDLIGISKVYDYQAKDSSHQGPETQYVISLYDTELFTKLTVNSNFISLSIPALVEGKNSGAKGFLYQNVTDSNTLTLYDTFGSFSVNETLIVNGVESNKIIRTIEDFSIGDANQISITGVGVTFTSDSVLSKRINLTQNNTFTITSRSSSDPSGISTVTSSGIDFTKIKSGDVISYTKPGDSLITYNKIQSINSTSGSFTIVSTPNISGVNTGSLPSSQITVTDLYKVQPTIINPTSNFYQLLENSKISSVDLSNTELTIKKSFTDVVSTDSITFPVGDNNLIFDIFDEENFTLSYSNTGLVVKLIENDNISFSPSRDSVTITGLTQTGSVIFTAVCKKSNISVRNKFYERCNSLVVNKSTLSSSGIGATTLNDGLTYSAVYGLRVQDKEISLNVADVERVLAIYESSNTNDPTTPKLELTNISSTLQNVVKGEKIVGKTSKSVGYLIGYSSLDTIDYVEANENKFIVGEEITFQESNLNATITKVTLGDRNIIDVYDFDNGYREQYLDFSRIVRKSLFTAPSKKIKIIYNNYVIKNTDSGDFITVNSYDKDRYLSNLPIFNNIYAADYLDFRPIVAPYSGNNSPFESKSRIFSTLSSSSPHIISRNGLIKISYDYYLPRIDKLFLSKNGTFNFARGVASKFPTLPSILEESLEIATLNLPAYIRNVNEIEISFTQHKRYTMKDISMLDEKIKNIEQYTILSFLELDTKNLFLKDGVTNLNKFKSGFFVDTFRSKLGSDIKNPDYKVSIDFENGELRPIHYTTSLDLIPGSNGNISNLKDLKYSLNLGSNQVKKVGDVICLNYDDVEYISNNFASLTENVNPFNISNWIVSLEVSPSSDTWLETRILDNKNDLDYSKSIKKLTENTNTGILPFEWNSWETIWSGSAFTQKLYNNQRSIQKNYNSTDSNNSIRIGDKKVSTDFKKYVRSRNIQLVAKKLKPNSRLYAFFDDVNVTEYMIPKLIEINMVSGSFIAGETVTGIFGSKQIRFRLANVNHKFGPIDTSITNLPSNYEVSTYSLDIYNPNNTLASSYSSTSSILNVDTSSLAENGISEFFGCISTGMRLVGNTSKATAVISNLRLVTDEYGTFIGSFFIPDATIPSTPVFENGSKTILLTTNPSNSSIYGFDDSVAIGKFDSTGLLETAESSILRIRNSFSELAEIQNQRLLKNSTSGDVVINLSNNTPLSQTFEVDDINGVYITKCDIYFQTKDTKIPVTLQVRSVELGVPTSSVLPFAEATLNPELINISSDGTVATTFFFKSPVYLEGGNQYALSLMTSSNAYNVWISRVGEPDITSISTDDTKVIVSQQPSLGSLYKFQPGNTWNSSIYDDLKFKLYRADFKSNSGTVYFYNPDLNVGNNQTASLQNNPLYSYSKSSLVSIGKSLTQSDRNLLVPGATITFSNNGDSGYFRADLVDTLGAIGIGSTLIITSQGSGFASTTTIFNNVKLISTTGYGISATASINVVSGIANTVIIINGGLGYSSGDVLTIDTNDTNNLGNNLTLTIPNTSGIVTQYNSVLLSNIQGRISLENNNTLVSNGTTITGATVSNYYDNYDDGIHFKVHHPNHGMYSYNNYVTIVGIEPDVSPVKLSTNVDSNATTFTLSSVDIFTTYENLPVSSSNPGYLLINNEIIRYTGVSTTTNQIVDITRFDLSFFEDSTDELLGLTYFKQSHFSGDDVFKYEFNGISLLRINKTHYLNDVNKLKYPISLDDYHIKIDMDSYTLSGTTYLKDRRLGPTTIDPLFFNYTKFGGTFINSLNQVNTIKGPKATQNILITSIRPNIQTLMPKNTNVASRVRTLSGTSVNGTEASFVDRGYESVSLNSNTFFNSPRIICSKINEFKNLPESIPGKKSFTLEFTLRTNDSKVSPMIDLERVNSILTTNKLNSPVSNYITDRRVNKLYEDPHASIYVTKVIQLEVPADSLKVIFDAYRHSSNDIRVAYRLIRDNVPLEQQIYELFPGYGNLDLNKNTLNSSNNTGLPDILVPSSYNINDIKLYEYTANNLSQFTGFQIKIMMSGSSQINVPLIRNFRAIATLSTSPEI